MLSNNYAQQISMHYNKYRYDKKNRFNLLGFLTLLILIILPSGAGGLIST